MGEVLGGQGAVFAELPGLKNRLPSQNTYSRLLRLLDPAAFGERFSQFMRAFSQQTADVVAVDGKTLCRSFQTAGQKSALHMVSAWSCEERLVQVQIARTRNRTRSRRFRSFCGS
ncbi:MAG: ISAs1 family transposase [Roseiarcus sp.]